MPHISKSQIKLVRSLQLKKNRDELSLFVAEGNKCIEELSKVFTPYLYIMLATAPADTKRAHGNLVTGLDNCTDAKPTALGCTDTGTAATAPAATVTATAAEIRQMSSLKTPQGAIAVFHKQPATMGDMLATAPGCTDAGTAATAAITLVLDGIQDPGNLGTIIRTAVWFGVTEIVCSPDTADCFGPKVVQATMGALAQVHIAYRDLPSWLATIRDSPIYGTLLDGKNIYEILGCTDMLATAPADTKRVPGNLVTGLDNCADMLATAPTAAVIIMGSEGNGISKAVRPFITHPIYIPTYAAEGHGIESLNVAIATGITLSVFCRKLSVLHRTITGQ